MNSSFCNQNVVKKIDCILPRVDDRTEPTDSLSSMSSNYFFCSFVKSLDFPTRKETSSLFRSVSALFSSFFCALGLLLLFFSANNILCCLYICLASACMQVTNVVHDREMSCMAVTVLPCCL